jgi:ABC-type polysaccharide/polyol phosphate transport system ATPase subunit
MAVLEAAGLRKAFRIPDVSRTTVRQHALAFFRPRRFRELRVLSDVNFELRQGESLGLMGRNGSGKSTLLKILSGIYEPDAGRVVRRASVTPILELGLGWNPELDAIDNVRLIGSVMGLSLAEIRRGMDEILAFAEVEAFANLKLQHYSSGMSARLAYAVAFHTIREVLILDEIFAVGDAGFRSRCEARYREVHAAGHAAILVSHDPNIISAFCTRALLLERGRITIDGAPDAVCSAYDRATVQHQHDVFA